jgi:hypothetical protein
MKGMTNAVEETNSFSKAFTNPLTLSLATGKIIWPEIERGASWDEVDPSFFCFRYSS